MNLANFLSRDGGELTAQLRLRHQFNVRGTSSAMPPCNDSAVRMASQVEAETPLAEWSTP